MRNSGKFWLHLNGVSGVDRSSSNYQLHHTVTKSAAHHPLTHACCTCLLLRTFTTRAFRHQLHELFENVGDEAPPPPGRDVSAEQWLRSKGASELQMEVADVCYANDFGCSVQQLGLREMIVENNK